MEKMLLILLFAFLSIGATAANEWDHLCADALGLDYVPHPFECKKYFACYNLEVLYEGHCLIGFAFDKTLKICVAELFVDCSHISTTLATTEETPIETTTPETSTTDSNWDYLCHDKLVFEQVPHPYDCGMYFMCIENEKAIVGRCPPDFGFDKTKQMCLPKDMVDCIRISTKEKKDHLNKRLQQVVKLIKKHTKA